MEKLFFITASEIRRTENTLKLSQERLMQNLSAATYKHLEKLITEAKTKAENRLKQLNELPESEAESVKRVSNSLIELLSQLNAHLHQLEDRIDNLNKQTFIRSIAPIPNLSNCKSHFAYHNSFTSNTYSETRDSRSNNRCSNYSGLHPTSFSLHGNPKRDSSPTTALHSALAKHCFSHMRAKSALPTTDSSPYSHAAEGESHLKSAVPFSPQSIIVKAPDQIHPPVLQTDD